MEIGETIINDEPDNSCFGCSPHNERGLRLAFTRVSESAVEVRYSVDADLGGAPNVVHGGVQATLIDEAIGMACRTAFGDEEVFRCVTAEFSLKYRRPVPTEQPLVVRGELLRREGRDLFLEGAILNEEGNVLTRAQARWVCLESD
jgi:uncharacterized protein (TIGR00369 family)